MLLKELAKEYEFDCHVRELSERTIQNYTKQIAYFYNFLEQDYNITQLEDVKPRVLYHYPKVESIGVYQDHGTQHHVKKSLSFSLIVQSNSVFVNLKTLG